MDKTPEQLLVTTTQLLVQVAIAEGREAMIELSIVLRDFADRHALQLAAQDDRN